MPHHLHTFLYWWFAWWLLLMHTAPGVLAGREEREYVHIKVHVPDIVKKPAPHPPRHHKAVRKPPLPVRHPSSRHPAAAAPSAVEEPVFKKLPLQEMTFYSQDPKGATPYMLNAPPPGDNALMLATAAMAAAAAATSAPNYGPALFGHDDIMQAPTATRTGSGGTTRQQQQLMQQLFTPELMSAAITAMTESGGGIDADPGGVGVDTNPYALMPNMAADDLLAALQSELPNLQPTRAAAALHLQQQLQPSRGKPRKRKKKFTGEGWHASKQGAITKRPTARRRPGPQHNYFGGGFTHPSTSSAFATPINYDEPNDFEYNSPPGYPRPNHEDDINAANDETDDEFDDADAEADTDGDTDFGTKGIDDDGIYDYAAGSGLGAATKLGSFGLRYNSIIDSGPGSASTAASAAALGGPLSYQEFLYSVGQQRQQRQPQAHAQVHQQPTVPTHLNKWPSPTGPTAHFVATPGNDIYAPSPSPLLSGYQSSAYRQRQQQQESLMQQQQPTVNLLYPQQAAATLSPSPSSLPLRPASTTKRQRYKKRRIRNKRKRNRIDF